MSDYFIHPPQFVSAFEAAADHSRRPWKNPPHMHSLTEVFFIEEGEGEFVIGGVAYRPQRGDLIIHRPLVEHQEASGKQMPFRAISVMFKGGEVGGKQSGSIAGANGDSPLFHLQSNYDQVRQYLQEMLNEYHEEKPGYVEVSSALLQTVLLLLLRERRSSQGPSLSTVAHQVKSYLEANYRIELTLNDLADIVHVSPYHLAHVFKEEVGVSPIQYLIKCRIEEAKRQLLQSERSIAEISSEVGYPNANYFNILFKKVTGENPGKYRAKRLKERGEKI